MMHLSQKLLDSDRILKEICLQQERIWKESLILVESRGFIGSREIIIFPEKRDPFFRTDFLSVDFKSTAFTSRFSIRLGGNSEDRDLEYLLSDLDSLGFQRHTNFTFRYDYEISITEIQDENLLDYIIYFLLRVKEKIIKDEIETKDEVNFQASFIVRRSDVLDIYQESDVSHRVVNKFYSETRNFFINKILSVLSS